MFILEIHLIGHEKQTYFLYKPLLNISKCLLNMVTWVTKYCTTYQKVFNIFLFNIIKIPSFDVLLHKYWSFRFAWSEDGFNLHFLYNLAISRFFYEVSHILILSNYFLFKDSKYLYDWKEKFKCTVSDKPFFLLFSISC